MSDDARMAAGAPLSAGSMGEYVKPRWLCRHRYSWHRNPGDYQCWKRGWLFGLCTSHFLDRCRWERRGRSGWVTIDLSSFSRPFVNIDEERPIGFVSVGIGMDGADPALEIGWQRPSKNGGGQGGDQHG